MSEEMQQEAVDVASAALEKVSERTRHVASCHHAIAPRAELTRSHAPL